MKALIVDDDRVLADLVAFTLRREGFSVVQAFDGPSAIERWYAEQPDLVILDVNLPKTAEHSNGFSICAMIRAESDVPIIMLTVRGEEEDIVYGLKAGADDYVLKPFSPRQLVARAQAVLRRSKMGQAKSGLIEASGMSLNPTRREVSITGGDPVSLTALEYRLFEYLALHAGRVMPAAELIDHVWGPGAGSGEMLRQLVRRLRLKIEPDPSRPSRIETLPGQGYGLKS
jgi:DNA-binding response OmpR family regulator